MKKYKVLIAITMVLLFISACAPSNEDTPEVDRPNENEQESSK